MCSLLSLKEITTVSIIESLTPRREYNPRSIYQEDAEAKATGKMDPDAQIQQQHEPIESKKKSKIQALLSRAQRPEV